MGNKKGNRLTVRTRDALIEAYIELLQEKFVPSKIKIKEICDRAGLSRRTFYSHFQTKDEILLVYLDNILNEMFTEFRNLEKERFVAFPTAATHFFQLWQPQEEIYSLIKRAKLEDLLITKLKDHHLRTYNIIVKNNYSLDDPEILNHFITHISLVFYGVLDEWMSTGMKRTPEEVAAILAVLFDPLVIQRLSEQF